MRVRPGLPFQPKNPLSFNSRTREGATREVRTMTPQINVSIHAPVRVRLGGFMNPFSTVVSIHAPVRVRRVVLFPGKVRICFNSRTREGATLP